MFAYNPTVNDMSGQIMGQGMIGAASTKADTMSQLGSDIGGALASIGGIYGELEGMKAKGRAFKKTMEVVGPSFGMTTDKLAAIAGTDLKNDMDWARFGETMMPMMPSLINATLAHGRLGVQQNAPYVEAGLKNQQNIAGGNVPHGSMGVPRPPSGMGNVEPDLPVADEDLPALTPPLGVVPQAIPGGDESMRRYNEWKRQRGY